MIFGSLTHRPRNVDSPRAASILYGDLGTSKAYVLGLAFALVGYQSFWLIFLVSVLILLVGLNYIVICKYYPMGGGAYTAVRKRSEILSLLGAFFLIADYLVTAALSTLSACHYFGFSYPVFWSMCILAVIGMLNYFGPRKTGTIALLTTIITVIIVLILGAFTIPHLSTALHKVQPLNSNWLVDWRNFASIIVALSGIEAIANITGIMKLDPGSTNAKPSVVKTSTPAIGLVIFEVVFFTTLFALAMQALPGLEINGQEVSAPGYPNVRDSMLRYMAEVYVGDATSIAIGKYFGMVVGCVFGVLLLSAANTAIVALVSLIYAMSRDKEFPREFLRLNTYGVPLYPLFLGTLIPIVLIFVVHDIVGLADLYAVGFLGAIAANLGSTSTDKKIDLKKNERLFMFGTFLILLAIEFTLLIDKPHARNFVVAVFACGLVLRGLVMEQRQKGKKLVGVEAGPKETSALQEFVIEGTALSTLSEHVIKADQLVLKKYSISDDDNASPLHLGTVLCPITHVGKTLEFALQECKVHKFPLYVLFVREQRAITEADMERSWVDDPDACVIIDYLLDYLKDADIKFLYVISDDPANSIVRLADETKASKIILGMPRGRNIVRLIRGNIVTEIAAITPPNIDILVIC